jgi:hypothetical protein
VARLFVVCRAVLLDPAVSSREPEAFTFSILVASSSKLSIASCMASSQSSRLIAESHSGTHS